LASEADREEQQYNDRFQQMSDEEIVTEIKEDDSQEALNFLLHKYRNLVYAKTRSYFLIGAEREDIFQEGMIGLFKAIRDFKLERTASFRGFADLCVTRQIITAIKAATRQKHVPLNSYVSLSKPIYEEDSKAVLLDVLAETRLANPEDIIMNQQAYADIQEDTKAMLSPLEYKVLLLFVEGKSYQEISTELGRHLKSIDNALQRIKRKFELYLRDRKSKYIVEDE